jgi:hypothetical protein
MKNRPYVVSTVLIILIATISFNSSNVSEIPKAWDVDKLHSQHLPYPDTTMVAEPISEEYYSELPERVAYKMYPFYMPGKDRKDIMNGCVSRSLKSFLR